MDFPGIVSALESRNPPPPLFPDAPWDEALTAAIDDWYQTAAAGAHNAEMLDACRSGLLLWNDDLDASHAVSQGIETPTGSFWHAIMHRREGDAANSQYWWRNTGEHPAFGAARENVLACLEKENAPAAVKFRGALENSATWTPITFVTAAQHAADNDDAWLRRVQVAEIKTLLLWCHERLAA